MPHVTPRILLGPGPSDLHPRVIQAMAAPAIGYLDSEFLPTLGRVSALLRRAFVTENELTLALSGSGTSGMEAALYNLLEPGDRAVVLVCGYFGARIAEIAGRAGAEVVTVAAPWGQPVPLDDVRRALDAAPTRLLAAVHGETSTGVMQEIAPLGRLAREHDALFLVDAVASLGGAEMRVDEWNVDACYAGSQKCLGAVSGLAPITIGERARALIAARMHPAQSWYLDLELIWRYWGPNPVYHHTPSAQLLYALEEALTLMDQEGLEARWARHSRNMNALIAGLEAMGLTMLVDPAHRLPSLTTVCVPEGVDDAAARKALLGEYGIEIAGGLGDLKGKVWRVGMMGQSSLARNVPLLLGALAAVLADQGFKGDLTAAREAASAAL